MILLGGLVVHRFQNSIRPSIYHLPLGFTKGCPRVWSIALGVWLLTLESVFIINSVVLGGA